MIYARQGDVIIACCDSIPEGAKEVPRQEVPTIGGQQKCYVLAYGEATGHAHRVMVKEDEVKMYERDGVLYLSVDAPTNVVHEEHAPVRLEPRKYKVWTQSEYRLGDTFRVLD